MRREVEAGKCKVLVLVSGGGTNLQAILDAKKDGSLPNAELIGVISNNPGAYALERAAKAGVWNCCISPKDFPKREDFEEALLRGIDEREPDLIVLAGFLVKIPEKMVRRYQNRIINVHPSLIPAFCGKGCYGMRVHEKALERGVKLTGATVHFVDEGTDTGPVFLQKAVEVKEEDTPESLQRRVMEEAEWKLLPAAIALIAEGLVEVREGKVYRKNG